MSHLKSGEEEDGLTEPGGFHGTASHKRNGHEFNWLDFVFSWKELLFFINGECFGIKSVLNPRLCVI